MKVERFQNLRPTKTPEQIDQQFKDVAGLYEKQFLREMVKAMRSTVQESGFIKSNQAEKIFKEKLDQEYVENWGARGGIGLADVIYNQLIEKFGPSLGLKPTESLQKGAMPLDEKSNYKGFVRADHPTQTQVEFRRPEGTTEDVKSPWAGKVTSVNKLSVNDVVIGLSHDNGLTSRFAYKGVLTGGLEPLSEVSEGQVIGALGPEAKALYWNISGRTSSVSE